MTAEELMQRRDCMLHRGPDASGLQLWSSTGRPCGAGEPGGVGLAHRRLKIIDLSEKASQPMSNETGTVWIAFNGEIYDYQRHRRELELAGHNFRSKSDTEVLLHMYEQHGLQETLKRVNGMFAFAIWDAAAGKLMLARDRVGKKPLYYRQGRSDGILFASEIKALQYGEAKSTQPLDPVALHQVWTVGCSVGERTVFEGIQRLRPASYGIWSQGKWETHEYWDCHFGEQPKAQSLDEQADELAFLLCDAIRIRMMADVPLGLFLSGGVDSSLVAAIAARDLKTPVDTFTIGFREPAYDESAYAARVARHLGLPNTILQAKDTDSEVFSSVARHFDEPFGDASAVPTWLVSRLARERVTVALTGDGGDEMFAGYDSFRQALRIWGQEVERKNVRRSLTFSERFWEQRLRWAGFPHGFMRLDGKISRRMRHRVFTRDFHQLLKPADLDCERDLWLARTSGADLLSRLQYVTFHTWLQDGFLRKVDMMSMAHGLECRSPLLDYRLVEFASRLPFEFKLDTEGRGKRILRHLLTRYLPRDLIERPKQGFYAPWEHWCQGGRAESLRARWQAWRHPWFTADAAKWLFPETGLGSNFLQWNAFVTLETLGVP